MAGSAAVGGVDAAGTGEQVVAAMGEPADGDAQCVVAEAARGHLGVEHVEADGERRGSHPVRRRCLQRRLLAKLARLQ